MARARAKVVAVARTRAKEAEAVARARAKVVAEAVARARTKVVAEAVARARGGGRRSIPLSLRPPLGLNSLGLGWSTSPHGHYMECTWPVTKVKYPAKEGRASWTSHETIADEYSCVVKLGGRQTQKRSGRAAPARLVVKGIHVEQCFLALLKESRRAFKGKRQIVFTSKTVPLN